MSAAAPTFLELCVDLSQQVGVSTTGPTTVASQTGDFALIVERIAEADLQIQNLWQDWNFLYDTTTFSENTAVGTKDHNAPATLGKWDTRTFVYNKTADTYQKLIEMPYIEWLRDHSYGTQTNSTPTHVIIKPSKAVILHPPPNAIANLSANFWAAPTRMSADGNTSAIPARFRRIIVVRAKLMYAEEDDAPEVYNAALSEYRDLLHKLESAELPHLHRRTMSEGEPIVITTE